MIEPHVSLAFAMQSSPGAYVALLGAGMSAAAGVPAAWEIQNDLISKLAAARGVQIADPIEWYRATYDANPSYDTLLNALAPTPELRRALLRTYFERSEDDPPGSKQPTEAHHALARLVVAGHVRIILTTNFDHLVETALRAAGVEPVVASSASDLQGLAPLHTLSCLVVHLHGDYVRSETMLNTPEELSSYEPEVDALLDRVFDEYGLLITGWSAHYDVALRDAWSRARSRRFTSFWVDPYPLSEVASDLAVRRAATVVTGTADAFLTQSVDAVYAITEAGTRHPTTAAAAVSVTKRLLATEQSPIRAHDLLRAELARVEASEVRRTSVWDLSAPDLEPEYHRRISRAIADTEVAAALVATLAYWGDPTRDTWWVHELEHLAVVPRVGGSAALIGAAASPATLLFYAAGTAAAAAGRWELVVSLLKEPHAHDLFKGEPRPIADLLEPGRTLAGQAGSRTVFDFVISTCREHLGLSEAAVQEAWERFAYLDIVIAETRLAHHRALDPYIRVTDLRDREYAPVPTTWLQRARDASESWTQFALSRTVDEAVERADEQLTHAANRVTTRRLMASGGVGFMPSGTWLPADFENP